MVERQRRTGVDEQERRRQMLEQRTRQSYETREDTGQFKTIFLDNIDPPLKRWTPGEGPHIFDIIPYEPGTKDRNAKPGEWQYWLEVFVHFNVGPAKHTFICNAVTYGKPCPICEERDDLMREEDFDPDRAQELKPSRRAIYNVKVYDNEKEERKGVQVWDSSHWLMERIISSLAKQASRGGGEGRYICFSDEKVGKSISFEQKGKGQKKDFIGHQFVDRDYEITDEELAQAWCLDEIIHIPSYEEVQEAWYGPEEPEQEEQPESDIPESIERPSTRRRFQETRGTEVPEKPTEDDPDNFCPGGGTFGKHIEELDHCGECEIYDDCAKAAEELAREDMKPNETTPSKPTGQLRRRSTNANRTGARPIQSRRRR